MDAVFELSWNWEFSAAEDTDKLDTMLGDLAAGKASYDGEYNLNIAYTIKITVDQVKD